MARDIVIHVVLQEPFNKSYTTIQYYRAIGL